MPTRLKALLVVAAFVCSAYSARAQGGDDAWTLGNERATWAISKTTGGVAGGWNAATREQYLLGIEGSYFLEDMNGVVRASERDDRILNSHLSKDGRLLEITCANAALGGVRITKCYSLDGDTLTRALLFRSGLTQDKFFSYSSEARLEPAYRLEGNYVGASCSFGPVEPAAQFTTERPGLYFGAHSKGMVLSNAGRGYSFAHFRGKMNGRFIFPWWTFNRVESDKERFYYTPSGWKIPFGVLKLEAGGEVSYEEDLSIFPGDSTDFIMKEYPARADVAAEARKIGPVPSWLADVKLVTSEIDGNLNAIQRMLEMTDEGYVMVMVDFGGNWADYYLDKEQYGISGGYTVGPELRDWVKVVKGLSPRVKVGLYTYMDATTYNSSILKKHPEWFRSKNKKGEILNHFDTKENYILNFTTMFNVAACRKELLSQYDRMLDTMGVDFVYMDDPLTNNLVNWQTGQVLTEADEYEFQAELRKVVRRHGPDKAVFLNGAGNHPYGDINFVEAYSRLSREDWRTFVGVALGVEAFLTGIRPDARVVPLYWTPELSREYINRVLALGWIPCLEYTDDISSRAFATAAYEIGNVNAINAVYSPDWRRDKKTAIESYAVRRLGDSAAVLSFIGHGAKPEVAHVTVETDSLGLDASSGLYAWAYEIRDATTFKGCVSERVSKQVYRDSGRVLDMVTTPLCKYAGPYTKKLAFDLNLNPDILNMVVITAAPAAVHSVEYLPNNFLFSTVRGVELKTKLSGDGREMEVTVNSERETCEVVAFAPEGSCVKRLALDGYEVAPRWVSLGGQALPLATVARGKHSLQVEYGEAAKTPHVPDGAIPAARTEDAGQVPADLPPLGLTSKDPAFIPGDTHVLSMQHIYQDNWKKKIMHTAYTEVAGIDVLSAATDTTSTPAPQLQPALKGLAASVWPETLTAEAGTTRKVQSVLGAAFAGFELKGVTGIKVKLTNTYYGAYNVAGPNHHGHMYFPSTRQFAGFVVDYHTIGGYTWRVALGVGVMHPECSTPYPSYGKGAKPDRLVDLGPIVNEGPEKALALDLARYAPPGWDGRAWVSVGSDWVASDRRLTMQILGPLSGTDQ